MDDVDGVDDEQLDQRAQQLRERIYVTFSALAVTLALSSEATPPSAGRAATTLAVSVLATLLAVTTADVVAHVVVHAALPTRADARQLARVGLGSLGVLVLPLLVVATAAAGVVAVPTALHATEAVLTASLVAVGYLAVRRLQLPLGQRALVLLAEAVLGVAVIALESLAH